MATIVVQFQGDTTWIIPANTPILSKVEAWGGGGGGQNAGVAVNGGGGGGGSYVRDLDVPVTASEITIVISPAGQPYDGNNWIQTIPTRVSMGSWSMVAEAAAGATGGGNQASGDLIRAGGNGLGAATQDTNRHGGASSGSPTAAGTDGTSDTVGLGAAGSVAVATLSGGGGNAASAGVAATNGLSPGGGAGGGILGQTAGGIGGAGLVRISYEGPLSTVTRIVRNNTTMFVPPTVALASNGVAYVFVDATGGGGGGANGV